jgi:hypothetical protein
MTRSGLIYVCVLARLSNLRRAHHLCVDFSSPLHGRWAFGYEGRVEGAGYSAPYQDLRCGMWLHYLESEANASQIEGAYPDLERFRGQWAAAHLVHESFHAQKTYTSCKGKDGTYRARHRQRRCRSLADSDNEEGDQEWSGTNPGESHVVLDYSLCLSVFPFSSISPTRSIFVTRK